MVRLVVDHDSAAPQAVLVAWLAEHANLETVFGAQITRILTAHQRKLSLTADLHGGSRLHYESVLDARIPGLAYVVALLLERRITASLRALELSLRA